MRLFVGLSVLFAAVLIFLVNSAWSDRTSKKIYEDISGFNACFRRLNATHQIGCASKQMGNVGVLHYIDEEDSLNWLIQNGTHKPYVVLLTASMFTRSTVEKLDESGKLSGILVDFSNKSNVPENFSPDHTCPNNGYGMYKENKTYANCNQVSWNGQGQSLMFYDYNVPVMGLTNSTEVEYLIESCYNKFNKPSSYTSGAPRNYPLCAAQAKDAMFAAKDTPTCMRRTKLKVNLNPDEYCDPLGDVNLIAFSRALNSSIPLESNSLIIAAARLDAFTMFDQITGGANSAVSGIVALLGAIHALKINADDLEDPSNKPIMYSLFNGEAFDYIGSSRMVYDMEKDVFPGVDNHDSLHSISLDHVGHIIEVSQVGSPLSGDTLWMHTDPITTEIITVQNEVDKLKANLSANGLTAGLTLESITDKQPLPPASTQQFLKKRAIPAVVLADHLTHYNNKYYNSRFDLAAEIDANYPKGMNESDKYNYVTPAAVRIQKLATVLSQTLYQLSTGSSDASHIVADNITIANLLYCILFRPGCDLFKAAMDPTNADAIASDSKPYDLYVGVYNYGKPNRMSFVLRSVLTYLSGKEMLDLHEAECKDLGNTDPLYRYSWIRGPEYNETVKNGLCMKSSVFYHYVKSPAFDIEDYDYSSNEYSSWTESRWAQDAMNLRVFLVPSREREIGTLVGGIAMLLASLAGGYMLKLRGSMLFKNMRMPYG